MRSTARLDLKALVNHESALLWVYLGPEKVSSKCLVAKGLNPSVPEHLPNPDSEKPKLLRSPLDALVSDTPQRYKIKNLTNILIHFLK